MMLLVNKMNYKSFTMYKSHEFEIIEKFRILYILCFKLYSIDQIIYLCRESHNSMLKEVDFFHCFIIAECNYDL